MIVRRSGLATGLLLTLLLLSACSTGDDGPKPTPTTDPQVIALQTAVTDQGAGIAANETVIAEQASVVAAQAATIEAEAVAREDLIAAQATTDAGQARTAIAQSTAVAMQGNEQTTALAGQAEAQETAIAEQADAQGATAVAQQTAIAEQADAQGATAVAQQTAIAQQEAALATQATKVAAARATTDAELESLDQTLTDQRDVLAELGASTSDLEARITSHDSAISVNEDSLERAADAVDSLSTAIAKNEATIAARATEIRDLQDDSATARAGSAAGSGGGDPAAAGSDWPAGAVDDLIQGCIDGGELSFAECTCFWGYVAENVPWDEFLQVVDYYDINGEVPEWFDAIGIAASEVCLGDTGGEETGDSGSNWPAGALEEGIQSCTDEGELTAAECSCFWTFLANNVAWNDLLEAFDYFETYDEFPDWFLFILYDAQEACL